ncbi:DUF3800 domain-containing protein [Bacillus velezensis]
MSRWKLYCEEAGDKAIPPVKGSSNFYVVTGILVREEDAEELSEVINKYKYKVLRQKGPLEWKRLGGKFKKDDKILSRFLRKIEDEGPFFLVTNVVCNKEETNGPGLVDRNRFMNYLYGLMFKKLVWFFKHTDARASLIIDRNTDKLSQDSFRSYISDLTRYYTGSHPRHSKPFWTHPELDPILGMADFLSGITLRSLEDYKLNVNESCKSCERLMHLYECEDSNFKYYRSMKKIVEMNYFDDVEGWDWRGLIYHPYGNRDKYKHLFPEK